MTEHSREWVREALEAVYGSQESEIDPVLAKMQFMSLPKEEW